MASTYTPLGIEKMATGENAGTWGTKTNTNLDIIEQISGGYKVQTLNTAGAGANTTALTQTFSGYMDQMNIQENPDTSTIELTVENKLIDLERPRVARYTSAYQKSVYPGDLGMDFIEDLQDKEIIWGRSPDKAKTA